MTASANKILNYIPKVSTNRKFVTLCGRIFRDADPAYFPRAIYRGRTIYFCTESCLGAFLADPDVFYKVHRNSEKRKEYTKT
jgi:YHS domain-containing protein